MAEMRREDESSDFYLDWEAEQELEDEINISTCSSDDCDGFGIEKGVKPYQFEPEYSDNSEESDGDEHREMAAQNREGGDRVNRSENTDW